jgi:hypothetical protein
MADPLLTYAASFFRNKVLIVKAGLLKKLPLLMADRDLATSHDLALLLRSVSSLANTDFPLPSADLLPFLVATLSGTTPAQSRAAKILRWFKEDGQDRIRAHSGPRTEATPSCHGSDGDCDDGTKHCQNAVGRIVKQSLERNVKSIMRRATASVDMTANDTTKMLVASSSSKSLPA